MACSNSMGANRWVMLACILLATASFARADEPKSYEKTGDVSGNLTSVGSDTLANLMTRWSEEFVKLYPNVKPQIEAKGSATAPPALIQGSSLLAPMSRKMKPEEEDQFAAKYGFKPTRVDVALDCLAVWVHKDNPVKGLTFAQLDCIFSKTRKSGFGEITTWGDAGVTDPSWAQRPISLYGRNSASGTYTFFKEHALLKGDFKDTVKEQPGSAGVVERISQDPNGIGYSGIGYRTSEVRAVPLAKSENDKVADATFENALNGSYPLGRTLYIYISKKPGEPMQPLVKEFLKFVLSKEGQKIVVDDGFGELPSKVIDKNLKTLD